MLKNNNKIAATSTQIVVLKHYWSINNYTIPNPTTVLSVDVQFNIQRGTAPYYVEITGDASFSYTATTHFTETMEYGDYTFTSTDSAGNVWTKDFSVTNEIPNTNYQAYATNHNGAADIQLYAGVYLYDADTYIINWGDGTAEEYTITSAVYKNHTYAEEGWYNIDLYKTDYSNLSYVLFHYYHKIKTNFFEDERHKINLRFYAPTEQVYGDLVYFSGCTFNYFGPQYCVGVYGDVKYMGPAWDYIYFYSRGCNVTGDLGEMLEGYWDGSRWRHDYIYFYGDPGTLTCNQTTTGDTRYMQYGRYYASNFDQSTTEGILIHYATNQAYDNGTLIINGTNASVDRTKPEVEAAWQQLLSQGWTLTINNTGP